MKVDKTKSHGLQQHLLESNSLWIQDVYKQTFVAWSSWRANKYNLKPFQLQRQKEKKKKKEQVMYLKKPLRIVRHNYMHAHQ